MNHHSNTQIQACTKEDPMVYGVQVVGVQNVT